jgi:hypothetical protein
MPMMNIPFKYMIDDDEYWNDDLFVEDDTKEFHMQYDFEDEIDKFIKDDMNVEHLIMNYIWNKICNKDLNLLNIFKCMYKNNIDLEGKYCKHWINDYTYDLVFQFDLYNGITEKDDTFKIEVNCINTSSVMAYWCCEFEDYLDEYNTSGSDSE